MRKKMNQIITWLETDGFESHKTQILSPKYSKALHSLIDTKCVEVTYAWGGDIIAIFLLNHSATYQLERREVWFNRFFGFVSGVLVTVAATLLLGVIA